MMIDTLKRRRIDLKERHHFSSRCSFTEFRKTLAECSMEVQTAFKQTPFKWFAEFDFPKMDPEFYAEVVGLYFPEKSSFQIGGTMIELTVDHIARITGLEKEGYEVSIKKNKGAPPSLFRMKYFDKRDPNVSLAKSSLRILREQENPDVVDKVWMDDQLKLLILILFGSFLFPHGDHAIYPGLFKYIEDLPNINKYSWAKAVHTVLHQGMAAIVKKKRGQRPLGYLKGCSSLLTVWALEILDIAIPANDGSFPAVGRWCYSTRVSTLLKEKNLDLWSLNPALIKEKFKKSLAVTEEQAGLKVEPISKFVEVPCSEFHDSMSNERDLHEARMVCIPHDSMSSEREPLDTRMECGSHDNMPTEREPPDTRMGCRSRDSTPSERELLDARLECKSRDSMSTEMEYVGTRMECRSCNRMPTERELLNTRLECRSLESMSTERELLDVRMECNKYERLWLEQRRENLRLREMIEVYRRENENLKDGIRERDKRYDRIIQENRAISDEIIRDHSQQPSLSLQLPKVEMAMQTHLQDPSPLLNS